MFRHFHWLSRRASADQKAMSDELSRMLQVQENSHVMQDWWDCQKFMTEPEKQ
jgi:hypothetical protein